MPHLRTTIADSGYGWVDKAARHQIAVVFVHGWGGDCDKTWTWLSPWWKIWLRQNVSLVELLTKDADLHCDYYSLAHSGGPFSPASLDTIASSIRTFLEEYVSAHKGIVLVAHSLGGPASRKAILEAMHGESSVVSRVIGILMYGSPNNGTELARAAGRIFFSTSAKQIRPFQGWLEALNRDWLEHVVNGGNPRQEITRRLMLHSLAVVGEKDRVVPVGSAAALSLISQVKVIHKNHRSLCKAATSIDPSYSILKSFIQRCTEELYLRPLIEGTAILQERARNGMHESLDWCLEETESITIERFSSDMHSMKSAVVNCRLSASRVGYPVRDTFHVGVRLAERGIVDTKLDYDYLIGQGLMEKSEYRGLAERLSGSSASREELERILKVLSINVTDLKTAQSLPYAFEKLTSGPGYAVMTFKCHDPAILQVRRDSKISFELQTTVFLEQGWYKYYCARPIIKKLHVELTAPCKLLAIPCCDRTRAEISEVETGFGKCTSVVDISGPVPHGSFITWLFGVG